MRSFLAVTAGWVPLLLALGGPSQGAAQEPTYEAMRAEVGRLYGEERFAEAAALLEEALPRFPEHVQANAYNLALMRVRLQEADKGVQALTYGLDHGVWFGKYDFGHPLWEPLKAHPGWAAFQARNDAAMMAARARTQRRLEVVLPEGYDPTRRYPLFLALHGGGENLEGFIPNWTSPRLSREFIVAYPQSTQLIAMNGYNWTEDVELTLGELEEAYQEVVSAYSVDTERVLMGGFSSGGVASLEVVLRNTLPVRGFVVLCPPVPEGFSPEAVRAAAARGVRGTLLTTEMDGRLEQQREMDALMTAEGLPHEFHVTPNVGHWYPDDLPQRIDRAIAHALEEEGRGR